MTELAGPGSVQGAEAVDRLLARAEAAYAEWTLESVRRAARDWLDAAAADESRNEGLIGASRAGVWLSRKEPDPAGREAAAESAVQAAQLCREAAPESATCTYWLAVSLGVQARERRTTALSAMRKIVKLLEQAADAEPGLEHAGPHRVLALVLLRAPGWPRGPGDPDRGLEQARLAVGIEPDFPPNQLCLAEALAATDAHEASRQAYAEALRLAEEWIAKGDPEAGEWVAEARAAIAG